MKSYKFYTTLLLLLAGCKENIIDLVPVSTPTTETFYKTSDDMINALNGVYYILRTNAAASTEFFYGDIATDDARAVPGYPDHADFDNFTLNPTATAPINGRWNDAYKGISRANILLEKIEAISMDNNLKNRIIGETKFLRAYYYFNLVKVYGDVPLILKELKTPDEAYTYGREPASNIYAQVEKDFNDAIPLLPASYPAAELGRATSGAAKGMLARVLMYEKKFSQAAPLLNSIISEQGEAKYQLLPNYADVFRYDNGNNKEILFAVQYTPNAVVSGQGSPPTSTFGPITGADVPLFGSNANQPTLDIYNAFEKGDLRRDISIAFTTDANKMTYVNKFINKSVLLRAEDGTDYPVLRYADILLMYAECLNEAGTPALALPYINQVRERAFGNNAHNLQSTDQTATSTYVSGQADLREKILKERRLELCFEGLRFFDLLRTDHLESVLNNYFTKNQVTLNGAIIQIGANNKLFPIPQAQIDVNPSKIKQNPGY
ncbi:RagB/SusD family nutrient uptake outer membrane protein [Dyadobacter sediminis]|uniref:RagB/SusD family nutrient uptake outer membrane protein n=1 Tax=Dyadobacter sediminis TaxID=1493691 RepID=A0A5R9K7I7_9BACT|nr:RagB/SusD family nutrient uptake outer membrane protein [Dyadobacter sediminis]TLU89820.1 RagB/SusD family nutrient uptake outer membrane protein [Dyadobacter sediminis]GGC12546.1 membrane protein [Dyadobacter sediminis]